MQVAEFIERYEFLDEHPVTGTVTPLARGGQGEVFRVKDHRLGRIVALKRLKEEFLNSAAARSRFQAEAQIMSQMGHPNFLPIFDYGEDPEARPYFTTILLESQMTFEKLVKRIYGPDAEQWTLRRGLEVLHQVCEAMSWAHKKKGVVHRDLKSDNVMIGDHGEIYLIDLGAAKSVASTNGEDEPNDPLESAIATHRGEALRDEEDSHIATSNVGRPMSIVFSPPEVLRGGRTQDGAQVDIFAVGVMLYELCAGRLPFSSPDGSLPSDNQVLKELILGGPPVRLGSLKSSVSRDLAAVCEKAMAREPENRYQSIKELADEIKADLENRPVKARRPGPILKFRKWALRHSERVIFALMFTLAVALGAFEAARQKSQKDHARQLTALREAELAGRRGQWRKVIEHLREAEDAGYQDEIHLALERTKAWRAVSEHDLARAQLEKLVNRPDLGQFRGSVLLRSGENELYDPMTFQSAMKHLREAMAAGLAPADEAFAKGLLAESTPEALEHFRQALQFDRYHHGAYGHVLGLEFLLGQTNELKAHLEIFETLFPDDPSPVPIKATWLALEGRLQEAERLLAENEGAMNPQLVKAFRSALRLFSQAAMYFDVEVDLGEKHVNEPELDEFMTNLIHVVFPGNYLRPATHTSKVRLPQLPCMKNGLQEGVHAVESLLAALALPFFFDYESAVERVKSSCRKHPESFLPLGAAWLLGLQQSTHSQKQRRIVQTQAELYQLAADLPSILPKGRRLARYRATRLQFELATKYQPTDRQARRACVENLVHAANDHDASAGECRAYFAFAFKLGEYDIARELPKKSASRYGVSAFTQQALIETEFAAGNYARVFAETDKILKMDPENEWAREKREAALRKLREIIHQGLESPPVKK